MTKIVTNTLPPLPGIYAIIQVSTERVYIGSSINIKNRIRQHLQELRSNSHKNPKLQNSWNKYGESDFLVEVKELTELEVLRGRENFYIESLKPFFNLVLFANQEIKRHPDTIARIIAAHKEKWENATEEERLLIENRHAKNYTITDPFGNSYSITNLVRFCKEHDISYSSLISVSTGRISEYRGWTCTLDSPEYAEDIRRIFKINGEYVRVVEVYKFLCLSSSSFYLYREKLGDAGIASLILEKESGVDISKNDCFKRVEDSHDHLEKEYELVSPAGETMIIKNLTKFCIDNDLNAHQMYRVARGGRTTYKGWRCKRINLAPNELINNRKRGNSNLGRKYVIVSPEGVSYESENMSNFCKDHSLPLRIMYSVISGKQKQYKGWTASRVA